MFDITLCYDIKIKNVIVVSFHATTQCTLAFSRLPSLAHFSPGCEQASHSRDREKRIFSDITIAILSVIYLY